MTFTWSALYWCEGSCYHGDTVAAWVEALDWRRLVPPDLAGINVIKCPVTWSGCLAKSWVWITRKHTDGCEEKRAERRGKHGSSGSHSPPPQLIVVRTRQRLGPAHEGEAIRNETLEKLPMGCAGSSVLLAISRPFQHHFKGTQVPKQRHLPLLHGAGSTTKTTSLNPLKACPRRFDPLPPQNLVRLSILSTHARLGQVSVGA